MIRKYLFLFLLSIYALSATSQGKFKPEWNIGFGGGATLSSVDFRTKENDKISTKTKNQYQAGLAVRYISEKNIGIIAELNYTQQGWDQQFKDSPQYSHSHQLNYIEMPLLTHIYFGNKVRFVVNFGPKVSYLFSETESINKPLADYLASGSMPAGTVTHQYYQLADNKFDYGILGGGGVELRTGIGNFLVEGRYYYGLSDIYNNSKTAHFTRSANKVMSVKLTYYHHLFNR